MKPHLENGRGNSRLGAARIVASLASLVLVASACGGGDDAGSAEGAVPGGSIGQEPESEGSEPGLLYVAGAGKGQVEGDGAAVTVSLTDVDDEVLWFQDRPGRAAGRMTVSDFVEQWDDNGFGAVPPNAVIEHEGGDDLGTVVEMSDPSWEEDTGTLAFTATVGGEDDTTALPGQLQNVSLFIDDAGARYYPVNIEVSNAEPGQNIALELSSVAGGSAAWTLGAPESSQADLSVDSRSAALPLTAMSVSSSAIKVETASSGGGGSLTFDLSLYLAAPASVELVAIRSGSDPGVRVEVSIHGAVPQAVYASDTEFELPQ